MRLNPLGNSRGVVVLVVRLVEAEAEAEAKIAVTDDGDKELPLLRDPE